MALLDCCNTAVAKPYSCGKQGSFEASFAKNLATLMNEATLYGSSTEAAFLTRAIKGCPAYSSNSGSHSEEKVL